MPESTKKRPSWLRGDLLDTTVKHEPGEDHPRKTGKTRPEMPESSMSGLEKELAGISSPGLLQSVRVNPAPFVIALLTVLVLGVFIWFVFLRGAGESAGYQVSDQGAGNPDSGSVTGAGEGFEDPLSGGAVRDSGVVFGSLQVKDDGKAELRGAGLSWSGTVTEKEGGEGETVTLEGPTAAQLERGFDLGESSVETGVYAIAQQSGEVLHVSTHTYRPEGKVEQTGEKTLGTVYALQNGTIKGYAYYLDNREEGADRVTRTYVRPGQGSYRVSFDAQPGTFVPLLVGWRGFEDTGSQQTNQQQKPQDQQEGE